MRKILAFGLAMMAGLSVNADNVTVTNAFPNYVLVASTNANSGTTGLAALTAYLCFQLSDLTWVSEAQANPTNGDIRIVVFSIVKKTGDALNAIAATNRPAAFTIREDAFTGDGSDLTTSHKITTKINLGTQITIPSE